LSEKHTSSLLDPKQVLATLLKRYPCKQDSETCSLMASHLRVLAEDQFAKVTVPPHDNSAVDGYALNSSEQYPNKIAVRQRIPAGCAPTPLQKGSAARIFTGANIPEGADCVVMQEHCETDSEGSLTSIPASLSAGNNIRRAGQDMQKGARILEQGHVLTPERQGLLASAGISELEVFKRLRVAYFSTGDELVEPGEVLNDGQIYNSNRYTLNGLLRSLDCEAIDLGCIPDNLDATKAGLSTACQTADLILSTGGASVGEEDHVYAALDSLGKVEAWRLAIKPGKPFMAGNISGVPTLGLPGNPSAVLVSFLILVRPLILQLQGCIDSSSQSIMLPAAFDTQKPGPRHEYIRVRLGPEGIEQHPNQSSGMLSSASWADGLALIPAGTRIKKGDRIEYFSFSSLMNAPR